MEEDFLKNLLAKGYILLPHTTPATCACLLRCPNGVHQATEIEQAALGACLIETGNVYFRHNPSMQWMQKNVK